MGNGVNFAVKNNYHWSAFTFGKKHVSHRADGGDYQIISFQVQWNSALFILLIPWHMYKHF